jgi:Ca-activated chloride channel family protein
MLARDLKPNRLEATKEVARQVMQDREGDRIAIVAYSGESYTLVPLTTDTRILMNSLDDLEYGLIDDGTAIGMGLATAVNRLRAGEEEGRVIILLTDGVNNTGVIDPLTSAELAAEFGLKTYTIGVGTNGRAPMPAARDFNGNLIFRNLPVEIDEDLLQGIAAKTGGSYFRATDNESLKNIYREIDRLETKEVEELRYYAYTEWFRPFLLAAAALFLLEILMRFTLIRGMS